MTEDRQILAKLDAKTAQLAIVVQQLAEVVKRREQKTGKPCFLQGGVLHSVSDASLASMVAYDDQGSGASLLGYELARMIFCDAEPLAGGLPPLPFGKGLRGPRSVAGEKVRDIIEHEKPAASPTTPSAPTKPAPGNSPPPSVPGAASKAATNAESASEAASLLTNKGRGHIFHGEVNSKDGAARGWHYEPSGDKAKGTYVIEGTRSPPDAHGVYGGNVMVEGVEKKNRSTFFPKDWTEKQVEAAIEEAYTTRKPEPKSGVYRGTLTDGMAIELRLDGKGRTVRLSGLLQPPDSKDTAP